MTRIRQRLLLGGFIGVAPVLLLCGILFLRPVARANRICREAGFGSLPASASRLHVKRRGHVFGTGSMYLRFQAPTEDALLFFDRSGIDPNNEPVPMRTLHFGTRSPSWMRWDDSVDGRIYHINRRNASIWLAIDDDSNTIYIGVYQSPPAWFRRLLGR